MEIDKISNKEFLQSKKNALCKLNTAEFEKKVDNGILPLLHSLNSINQYYTTSSCAGRIVLLELPSIGDKKNATFLGKWHRQINQEELSRVAKKAKKGWIWFLAQSPILHVGAKTLHDADDLVKHAISCGFKNTGIRSISKKIIIEICSTERLDLPIGRNGQLFCEKKYLNILVETANEVLIRSQEKLYNLYHEIKNKYM
jgi:tRNA wybutosine-synthesizing protein 3